MMSTFLGGQSLQKVIDQPEQRPLVLQLQATSCGYIKTFDEIVCGTASTMAVE